MLEFFDNYVYPSSSTVSSSINKENEQKTTNLKRPIDTEARDDPPMVKIPRLETYTKGNYNFKNNKNFVKNKLSCRNKFFFDLTFYNINYI